ncbi:MAG: ribosomal protein S18-alanine N-acetyltransferase [Lachnospiraceae bacterium]|nr:ribosomal protein S18-alanine N-acetyltransferase [Lachnospiraceae bacterium]MBP3506275.1 ribosomal protein S18-alanine N-acetyltransferase [Lachnospiraceae bacterium]
MIIIRPMAIEDCEAVHEIDRACFTDAWSLTMFEDLFYYPTNFYFVAEEREEGALCGFGGIIASIDTADIMNIGVLPEYRRRGVGQQLLEALIIQAETCGCEQMMLEVRKSNTPAIQLYESNGFHPIAIRKNYYSNPIEDGIIMQRLYKK